LIEFKRDKEDGSYKIMDINIRPFLTISLPLVCGINFPYIMYRHLMNGETPENHKQKNGIYWIDLYKDIYHFFKSKRIEGYSLSEYIKPYRHKKTFAIFNRADPNPFRMWMWYLLNRIKKKK
jgi:predicted ATP-grasp superfamily ATP-dependent carboligase